MGRDVPAIIISHQDRRAYREKVRRCLDVLARMLRESRFDTSDNHVGLEMEFYLADDEGRAAPNNADVLSAIADEAWANELAQFNIELSVAPTVLTGEVFTALEGTIDAILAKAGERAATAGSRLVMVLSVIKEKGRQINYGTGKDVSDETIADAKPPLKIRWFSDSYIEVPVRR